MPEKKTIFDHLKAIAPELSSFYQIFIKLADKLYRHKILVMFDFLANWNFHFRVISYGAQKTYSQACETIGPAVVIKSL